jgi:exosome complex RNA-binding protein Rrp42 (RNase PH superfamily)
VDASLSVCVEKKEKTEKAVENVDVFIIFAIFASQIILEPTDDEREKHKDC